MADHQPITFEEVVAECKLHGVRLSNMFQLSNGLWRCNVRTDDDLYGYGYSDAPTPTEAFRGAIRDLHRPGNKHPIVKAPPPRTVQLFNESKAATKGKSGDELLKLLGL